MFSNGFLKFTVKTGCAVLYHWLDILFYGGYFIDPICTEGVKKKRNSLSSDIVYMAVFLLIVLQSRKILTKGPTLYSGFLGLYFKDLMLAIC